MVLSNQDHETLIKNTVSEALNVNKDEVSIDFRLMGGMSNFTYVIDVAGTRYTFRIPGKNAENFVNRDIEAYHIDLIKPLDLNNETVYFNKENGIKIAKYIDGTPLHEAKPLNYLEASAEALKTIHESGLKSAYDYDPFGRIETYEGYVKDKGLSHEDRYFEYKDTLYSYQPFLDQFERTLTHGDAQVSNFVITENGTLKLMDWEFTGMNDPFFDLAQYGNKDFDHAVALLGVYLGRTPNHKDFKRLYLWRVDLCLQWHNVALYKHAIGLSDDLQIPFDKVAASYLDKAAALLAKL